MDLLEQIEQYKLIITSIDNAMSQLDEREKQFVKSRYFESMKMYEVKTKMNVSEEKTLYHCVDKF